MILSKVALDCLQSSPFFAEDILFRRDGVHECNRERPKFGEFHTLYQEYRKHPAKFYEYTRMSVDTFDYILEHIEEYMEQRIKSKRTVSNPEKLFLTLKYLALGLSFKNLSQSFRLGRCTVSNTIYITTKAILKAFEKLHLPQPTEDHLTKISEDYFTKWEFPNCVGSIGVKNFRIKKHYKHDNNLQTLVLHGISDADYKIIAIEIGGKAESDDGFQVKNMLSKHKFYITPPRNLPNSNITIPCVLIGNESFPLKTYLMRPYPTLKHKVTEKGKALFNEKLAKAYTIKHTLNILTNKWRVLIRPIEMSVEHTKLIIKTACLLHNIIREKDGDHDEDFIEYGRLDSSNTKTVKSKGNNRSADRAYKIRDQFRDYFVNNSSNTENTAVSELQTGGEGSGI